MTGVGILSYGVYIPFYRLKVDDIAGVWGKQSSDIKSSLGIAEKSVAGFDEDSVTLGFEASHNALSQGRINPETIEAILVGSESHPYAVNPASTILAEFLGIEKNYLAYDTEFACKAATGALISAQALIKSGYSDYALIAGSDKGMGKTHDVLEYTAASASVSLLLGKDDLVLEILNFETFSSDTPDFWRREGIRYPSHGGRFTGKPSYFYHIQEASKSIFKKTGLSPKDFTYGVFHMPNGKFPVQVARSLGFTEAQIKDSLTVNYLGNSYTASALIGLISVLEKAKPGDLIFLCSYGSGAGSDSFVLRVTKNILRRRKKFSQVIEDKKYIDYPTYLKFMEMI